MFVVSDDPVASGEVSSTDQGWYVTLVVLLLKCADRAGADTKNVTVGWCGAEHTSLEGAVMALFADDGDEGLCEECAECTPLGERRARVNRECSTPPQEMESERFVPEMLREDDADALQFIATSTATAAQDCVAIHAMLLYPHRQRLPHRPLRRRTRNTKNSMVEDGLKNVEHGATAYTIQGLEDASAISGSTALASLEDGKAIFAQIARSSPNRASVGRSGLYAPRGQAAHDLCYTCARGDCFPPTHASPPSHSSSHPTTTSLLFASSTHLLFLESTVRHPTFTLANSRTFAERAHAFAVSRQQGTPARTRKRAWCSAG
ncbi:hypothetical protein C8R45DRAFT_1113995 [Mycena sanguinolenta]|nr:hypothetical protein C8R45DRAFT_1113995 [Mycena sanguinolenta]